MRHLFMIHSLLLLMLFSFPPLTQNALAQSTEDKSVQFKIQRLEDNVSEVRRDQLNYKIEKDLLKETFSSNYQTINIVLAIVLGLFTIIGFLGIRDIGTLRKEFINELERLNGLRNEFEAKVVKIGEEQEKAKAEYLEIIKTNKEQNNRIKVLELQEKISTLMKNNSFQRALEYIAIALDMAPDDMVVLGQKALCLWRTNDLAGAASIYAKKLSLDASDTSALTNLLEIYLISNRIEEYEAMAKKHAQQIEARENGFYLIPYFESLKCYQLNAVDKMKEIIKVNLKKFNPGKTKRLDWTFSDLYRYLADKPADKKKSILLLFVNVLSGDLDRDDAILKIDSAS